MKSIIVNKIKKEFGIKNFDGKKLEQHKFSALCAFYDKLTEEAQVKVGDN